MIVWGDGDGVTALFRLLPAWVSVPLLVLAVWLWVTAVTLVVLAWG